MAGMWGCFAAQGRLGIQYRGKGKRRERSSFKKVNCFNWNKQDIQQHQNEDQPFLCERGREGLLPFMHCGWEFFIWCRALSILIPSSQVVNAVVSLLVWKGRLADSTGALYWLCRAGRGMMGKTMVIGTATQSVEKIKGYGKTIVDSGLTAWIYGDIQVGSLSLNSYISASSEHFWVR